MSKSSEAGCTTSQEYVSYRRLHCIYHPPRSTLHRSPNPPQTPPENQNQNNASLPRLLVIRINALHNSHKSSIPLPPSQAPHPFPSTTILPPLTVPPTPTATTPPLTVVIIIPLINLLIVPSPRRRRKRRWRDLRCRRRKHLRPPIGRALVLEFADAVAALAADIFGCGDEGEDVLLRLC